jgi:hypothetical protein
VKIQRELPIEINPIVKRTDLSIIMRARTTSTTYLQIKRIYLHVAAFKLFVASVQKKNSSALH